MKKLWQKEHSSVSEIVETFTVGKDKMFDLLLAAYDVQGSAAHVRMLGENGLMPPEDADQAILGLNAIAAEIEAGNFLIEDGVEDVHSQVELLLTRQLGDIGKMIHSGRSRNDQVAVDIKLFLRAACIELKEATKSLFDDLITKSNLHQADLIPGYTHLQIAMPSSVGLWLGAYAESLVDDLALLATAYKLCNKNPLGSGAGYGSSFPLNRKRTTELLGFETLHWNSIYAQMSRGKTEKTVAIAIGGIAATLSKLALDCCLYLNQDFGFISFPEALTTGSSIMPHKKNPDVLELIRGKCNRIQAIPNELTLLINNLPSGYHRELQLTKEILFPALTELGSCLQMMRLMLQEIKVTKDILKADKYQYLFSVEAVNELVLTGVPFRAAYQQVGKAIEAGTFSAGEKRVHTHEGSIDHLCNEEIIKEMEQVLALFP
ncbi:argininosuccinate lyase [Taibaiella sp. KBW10]|uniref:argininosuccinate lyase n=1 Tax=Taibaiella sp. KBW10 TaxID=2153357 RepID=UPI000F5AE8EA|nr:argininosuccinate lyase [Taibaiella sp. KBW10]RQO30880.1 argininosuccinate lyase [Taibaiella sp. KBW10]